jgi:hypothetical protein
VTDHWVPLPEPVAQPLTMPSDYGTVGTKRLPWSWASERLVPAMVYWLTTIRADGAPHVRPVDGMWVDNALFVGGSTQAAWVRNLARDGRATVSLPDVRTVVILEGEARQVTPDPRLADRLAAAAKKYESMYGPASASDYLGKPVWAVLPHRAMGWERFPTDATRWEFDRV